MPKLDRFELRIGAEDKHLAQELAEKLGVGRAAVYSIALRRLAEAESITKPPKPDPAGTRGFLNSLKDELKKQ